ncbi:MAG: hypothetical protein AVDCRST_MAG43-806 [uncultured Thermomicrobiales bacterium]|uniref:Uncharacterized protein n=1 Tax=uncultured Thermomicrobiales bacterium TaxID=1645740 RepID=A0A6J4UGZ5_9BACT|nr:MAG: hypothetical protein AVDCRST_MAG43-806 [uncultured Thermomicrobiales bacterium]
MARYRRRLENTAQIMERLQAIVSRDNPKMDQVVDCYTRLRKLADEQREEIVPLPSMQTQNDVIYRTIDLEARKAEDIMTTGGANLEALIAEEDGLQRQRELAVESSRKRTQEVADAYGIAPPDFSDRTRK